MRARRWPTLLLVFLVLGGGGVGLGWRQGWFQPLPPVELTAVVARGPFSVVISERGELESSLTYDCRCEVEGREIKVVEIVPEGHSVKKGDVVVRFDTEQLTRTYADQEIKVRQAEGRARAAKEELEVTRNKADSDIANAELTLDLAVLDRNMYIHGEYQVELKDRKQLIALAQKELEETQLKLDHFRTFVKKGFGTPDQLRQREAELEQRRHALARDQDKLMVLEKFTYERKTRELKAKAEDAERNLERTKSSSRANIAKAQSDLEAAEVTVRLETSVLERLQKQLDNCVIKAPQDGIVVYSKERYWDAAGRIQPGAMVYYRQHIFSLPDLSRMQVKAKIHETLVKKVKPGNRVEVVLDAFPTRTLSGTVKTVATLADSQFAWDERSVKEYVTMVTINDLPPDLELKPGMTALVRIAALHFPEACYVPLQAVAHRGPQAFVFRRTPQGPVQTEVVVGEANDRFVIIQEGVSEGDVVMLGARQLLTGSGPAEAPTSPTASSPSPEAPPVVAGAPGPGG
ncbi:MAG TPA: efflux RND transporter periplasmic adaptor subunit [Gemmatales bacterium]|nr:efflux RND transporter periplasmic adaptor subunit [Gemmatales bacterium]